MITNWQFLVRIMFILIGLCGGLLTYIHPASIIFLLVLLVGSFVFRQMPEIFIALYVLSGFYKSILPGPDITVVFFGLSLLAAVLRIYEQKEHVLGRLREPHFIFIGLFTFWMILSLTYTSSYAYALDKTFRVAMMTIGAFVLPAILVDTKDRFRRLLIAIALLGSVMTFISVAFNTRTVFGSNYLALGFIGGITALILTFYFLPTANKGFISLLLLINTLGIVTSAARGAVLFTPVTLIATILISSQSIRQKLNSLAILCVTASLAVALLYAYTPATFETLLMRLSKIENETGEESGRGSHMTEAVELIKENSFIGVGIGGYGLAVSGTDGRNYPHNIFLEVGAELGLVGLLLFVFFLISLIIYFIKHRGKFHYIDNVVVATAIFAFLNALKSNNLEDNRIVFMFLGFLAIVPYLVESELNNRNESTKT